MDKTKIDLEKVSIKERFALGLLQANLNDEVCWSLLFGDETNREILGVTEPSTTLGLDEPISPAMKNRDINPIFPAGGQILLVYHFVPLSLPPFTQTTRPYQGLAAPIKAPGPAAVPTVAACPWRRGFHTPKHLDWHDEHRAQHLVVARRPR